MEIFKIVGLGLATIFLALIVKQSKPEFYFLIILVGGIILSFFVLKEFSSLNNFFNIKNNGAINILAFSQNVLSEVCSDEGMF